MASVDPHTEGPQPLGRLGSTLVTLVETQRPWATGVDLLVVSVGPKGTGALGRALAQAHPEAGLEDAPFSRVRVEDPLVFEPLRWQSSDQDEQALRALLLVTLHTREWQPSPEEALTNIDHAVRAALLTAARFGSSRLGLSLLGAGAIGLHPAAAARALVGVLQAAASDSPAPAPAEILLLAYGAEEADALLGEWRALADLPGSLTTASVPPSASSTGSDSVSVSVTGPASATAQTPLTFSESAREVLRRAAAGRDLVDDGVVLEAGLVQGSPVSEALRSWLGSAADDLTRGSDDVLPASTEADEGQLPVVPGVADVVDRARSLAMQTVGAPQIHTRHLLAASVTGRLDEAVLDRLKTTPDRLRERLSAVLEQQLPDEWERGWREVLTPEPPGALAGGINADLVRPDEGLPTSHDHLGMSTYVGMMATIIAREDTPLPLSIGLFGEWGSGKSTFMGLLRGRVDELAKSKSPDYLRDIKQIGFNAWTYADANLWASLGDEIFRALIGPDVTDDALRRTVRSELESNLGRADDLTAARARAEEQAAALQADVHRARTQYVESLAALGVAAAGEALEKVWSVLDVTDTGEVARRGRPLRRVDAPRRPRARPADPACGGDRRGRGRRPGHPQLAHLDRPAGEVGPQLVGHDRRRPAHPDRPPGRRAPRPHRARDDGGRVASQGRRRAAARGARPRGRAEATAARPRAGAPALLLPPRAGGERRLPRPAGTRLDDQARLRAAARRAGRLEGGASRRRRAWHRPHRALHRRPRPVLSAAGGRGAPGRAPAPGPRCCTRCGRSTARCSATTTDPVRRPTTSRAAGSPPRATTSRRSSTCRSSCRA